MMAAIFTRLELSLKISGWTAVVAFLMLLSGPTYSLAGGLCIGTEVALNKGEAVVRCPLPVDVKDTRHKILVKDLKGTVLACYWTTEDADKPECKPVQSSSVSLVVLETDQLVVKIPESMLGDNGIYKAQLIPGEGQRSVVTPATPVVSSTATDRSASGQDPPHPPCEGQGLGEGLWVAILVLQIFTIIFLGVHICWRCRNKQSDTPC